MTFLKSYFFDLIPMFGWEDGMVGEKRDRKKIEWKNHSEVNEKER